MLLLATASILVLPSGPLPKVSAVINGKYFDHLVVIVMENEPWNKIYNSPNATYLTSLANTYSMVYNKTFPNLGNYTQLANNSLNNYLGIIGGNDTCAGTDTYPDHGCTVAAWNRSNLVDRLETQHVTWKAYMENMTGTNCNRFGGTTTKLNGNGVGYVVRHDPFVYFEDIDNSTSRCANIVTATAPADPTADHDNELINDLNDQIFAPNFAWLTPDLCDDMHGNSSCPIAQRTNHVAYGDNYTSHLIPRILNSWVFTHTRAALFVTFDEPARLLGASMYAVWAGPQVKHGYQSHNLYNHYSLLRTIEDNWWISDYLFQASVPGAGGIITPLNPCCIGAHDSGAMAMAEFFGSCSPKGDVSRDGNVDIVDLASVGAAFGSSAGGANWNAAADLNGDGVINILDLVIVARNIGQTTC